MASVIYTDYYMPDSFLKAYDIIRNDENVLKQKKCEEYCNMFLEQTGLNQISQFTDEDVMEVYDKLFKKMLSELQINIDEIAYFLSTDLYSNISPGYSIADFLIEKYHIPNATRFSIHQNCGSTLLTMGLARELLNEKKKYMILLSSCRVPADENRYNITTIVGDALGIMVLSYEDKQFVIQDFNTKADGRTSYNLYYKQEKTMDGLEVVIQGVNAMKNLLKRNNLTIQDVDLLIPQNLNVKRYSSFYAKMLGLPEEKMFLENIECGGHLGDVDIIRNICDYRKKQDTMKEGYILLYALAGPVGMDKSYNAVLIKV